MARVASLRWRVGIAVSLSLLVTGIVLVMSLAAAAGARAAGRELSTRLVPAAAAAQGLLNGYNGQQSMLREYVTSGQPGALAAFRRGATAIPGQQAPVAGP